MNIEFEVLCDTIRHISEVQENLEHIIYDLKKRGIVHDRTKFEEIEFDTFCESRPEFKKVNYGTPEYQAVVEMAKVGVNHHYENNRHHTAFHCHGVEDMNLIDILEMIADWKAASRRSPDLSFEDSFERAFKKYGMDKTMQQLIINTVEYLGWID